MTEATRRWLARASFALMGTAVALMLAVAGWHSLTLVVLAAVGACAVLVGVQAFLASRGLVRWLGLLLGIAAPVFILVTFALAGLLWVAVASIALMLLAAPAPGPDHEPVVGRREGGEIRVEAEGRAPWCRGRTA